MEEILDEETEPAARLSTPDLENQISLLYGGREEIDEAILTRERSSTSVSDSDQSFVTVSEGPLHTPSEGKPHHHRNMTVECTQHLLDFDSRRRLYADERAVHPFGGSLEGIRIACRCLLSQKMPAAMRMIRSVFRCQPVGSYQGTASASWQVRWPATGERKLSGRLTNERYYGSRLSVLWITM